MKKVHTLAIDQKEDAKHGESFFPVQKYITNLSSEYMGVTNHWHEEAELTLIKSGKCIYKIDLVEYEVEEGDILFVPPLFLHSITLGNNKKVSSETYVFHLKFLGGNSTDICSTRYLAPIMNQEFSMPYVIKPNYPAYVSLALKSLFLQTVFLLLQYSKKVAVPETEKVSDKIKNVLDYIELHYSETITVSQLAKLCYFSDYHFMRFFKKHMNMTCVEYINNLRLEKAVELFEKGNSSIMEVSLSVGFHNLSYFHRAFKKKYRMTPLSFINDLKKYS